MMTNREMFEAMERGHDRFVVKRSGRAYRLDPAQRGVLKPFEDNDVLLVGYPEMSPYEMRMRRYRGGRVWQWLSPKNLTLA